MRKLSIALTLVSLASACTNNTQVVLPPANEFDPAESARIAASIEETVQAETDSTLTLRLWAMDSLVISPIAMDIDDHGRLYYTTTERQNHSEFDIRGHRQWEIPSIAFQTVEDRRAFLRKELSPENSHRNTWLADLNDDGSHDWRDLTIERERVYRIEDISGDGIADKSQLIVHDFHEEITDVAGGVFVDGDNMYLTVAPDLWKMTDTNGDGIPDKKESLSHGYGVHVGFSGHGMSGVKMGPDGRLYWQIGDIGFNGVDKDGNRWEHPNSGVIARANPDGSDFEIFAHGLRNTHQFVFDEYGNIISVDNDGDHAGELERLVYIVNGSDAGWRTNWQFGKYRDPKNNGYNVWMNEKMYLPRFEGQAAYITPCITNYVGGPAGMAYNPGTALGPKFHNSFFVAEFYGTPASSGVHHFKLEPNGASFALGERGKILGGVLATALDFGPDGALYVADWIDGWGTHDYGRIWKLDDESHTASVVREEVKHLLPQDFSHKTDSELSEFLNHSDMRVRQKAQFALAQRGDEGATLFKLALQQRDHQLARVHAIWGLSQMARQQPSYAEPLLSLLQDQDAEIRAQAAKWLGDIRYSDAGGPLIPLLSDTVARVRFFAAEALGRIKHHAAVSPIIRMLEANDDEDAFLRHAGALALARIGDADPIIALSSHSSRALRVAAVVALRRMGHEGVSQFLNDDDEFVVTEAARAINDDLSIEGALPALAALLNHTDFSNEALIRRVINANLRVGQPENRDALAQYAFGNSNPVAMRAEASDALGTWASPSVLNRVDGRYHGPIERDETLLKKHTADTYVSLLSDTQAAVRLSATKAIARIGIETAGETLLSRVRIDADPEVRSAALRSLVELDVPQQAEAIKYALADKQQEVRVTGLDLVASMNIPRNTIVELLAEVIATKTDQERQAALLTLGKIPIEHTESLFESLLDDMAQNKLNPALYLELHEAIDSAGSKTLQDRYASVSQQLNGTGLAADYYPALYGGDERRGRAIFIQNQQAQCMRCHAYDNRGGNAGPPLDGIANLLTHEQLLEAMIDPGKRIAPGYGIVILELDDGETVSGIYQGEDQRGVQIRSGGVDRTIALERIKNKTLSPSSMTDMKGVLSPREIRDVVSFLATLTET